MKLELNAAMFRKMLGGAAKFLPFLSIVIMTLAIGYSAYNLSQVLSIAPTEQDVTAQRQKLAATKIKFDVKTIDSVSSLVQVEVPIDLTNVGKADPFAP